MSALASTICTNHIASFFTVRILTTKLVIKILSRYRLEPQRYPPGDPKGIKQTEENTRWEIKKCCQFLPVDVRAKTLYVRMGELYAGQGDPTHKSRQTGILRSTNCH